MAKKKGNNMISGIQIIEVPTHWVVNDEKRFDASFYTQDVITARITLDKASKKIKVRPLKELVSNIFWPGRFKRSYTSKSRGKPFLTPSEVFMFLPKATKYIINYPNNVIVKERWLLVTRSGTIGRCLITTKHVQNFVLSDDLIRIIPKGKEIGYLYAYLNTWIGQSFLTKDRYGVTVKHIEPHHVANIPTPVLPKLQDKISQKILEAHKLREEAQELFLKAKGLIYSKLGLPKIDEEDVECFGGEKGKLVKAFEIKADALDYRFDASYHAPILRLIKKNLQNGEKKDYFILKPLGSGVAKVFHLPTYKRLYVKPDEGYPVLSGVNLRQMKLYELKYISGATFNKGGKSFLNKYKIKKGWILTTERGTTGLSSLVTEYWDGWLASHNILRVRPQGINSGFLLAYLATQYAQYQLKSKELGAVVEVLDPKDMENILVPIPKNKKSEEKIGSLIIKAYNKKDKANQIEKEAIKQLENELELISSN